jgi:hypothetical protein
MTGRLLTEHTGSGPGRPSRLATETLDYLDVAFLAHLLQAVRKPHAIRMERSAAWSASSTCCGSSARPAAGKVATTSYAS